MPTNNTPPPEHLRVMDRASMEAALDAASLPLLANRFEIISAQDDTNSSVVLVLGGLLSGMSGPTKEEAQAFAKVKNAWSLLNKPCLGS